MKKLLKFLPFLLVALMVTAFWSCSDDNDDNNKEIPNSELPQPAKEFLDTYYPSISYTTIEDKDDYEVYLANNHEVEFSKAGDWKDVDAPMGQQIPSGFYPSAIDTYVEENGNAGINEISKEGYGFEVKLVTGTELRFSADGTFMGIDK